MGGGGVKWMTLPVRGIERTRQAPSSPRLSLSLRHPRRRVEAISGQWALRCFTGWQEVDLAANLGAEVLRIHRCPGHRRCGIHHRPLRIVLTGIHRDALCGADGVAADEGQGRGDFSRRRTGSTCPCQSRDSEMHTEHMLQPPPLGGSASIISSPASTPRTFYAVPEQTDIVPRHRQACTCGLASPAAQQCRAAGAI